MYLRLQLVLSFKLFGINASYLLVIKKTNHENEKEKGQ